MFNGGRCRDTIFHSIDPRICMVDSTSSFFIGFSWGATPQWQKIQTIYQNSRGPGHWALALITKRYHINFGVSRMYSYVQNVNYTMGIQLQCLQKDRYPLHCKNSNKAPLLRLTLRLFWGKFHLGRTKHPFGYISFN